MIGSGSPAESRRSSTNPRPYRPDRGDGGVAAGGGGGGGDGGGGGGGRRGGGRGEEPGGQQQAQRYHHYYYHHHHHHQQQQQEQQQQQRPASWAQPAAGQHREEEEVPERHHHHHHHHHHQGRRKVSDWWHLNRKKDRSEGAAAAAAAAAASSSDGGSACSSLASRGSGAGGRLNAMSSRGLHRSLSFTGLFTSRGSPSPTSPCGTPVLGEGFRRSPMIASRRPSGSIGFSFRKTPKLPEKPRPNRALLMFFSVKRGLRECIKATEEDIEVFRLTEQETCSLSSGQQVKAAERYKKRLEYHLTKIEELEESYMLQQQLLEGVRNMARAYVSLPGHHQRESLLNVKCGYKECKQTMCAIEAQLESMLGTFHCKMKGIAGFARVIPGDVFEVSVRHGHQKFKTKGRIGVGQHQTWDHQTMVFRAMVGEILAIKATELRGLGKSVVLGQKNCETKDLFSSHPQLMTVNINAIGSLKVSLIVTWIPLEGVDESMSLYEPPPRTATTPKHRVFISPVIEEHPTSSSFGDLSGVQRVELRSRSSPEYLSSVASSASSASSSSCCYSRDNRLSAPPSSGHPSPTSAAAAAGALGAAGGAAGVSARPNSVAIMSPLNQAVIGGDGTGGGGGGVYGAMAAARPSELGGHKPRLFGMRLLLDGLGSPTAPPPPPTPSSCKSAPPSTTMSTPSGGGGVASFRSLALPDRGSLEEALHSLSTALEDYQGKYPEMQKLEQMVDRLDRLIKKNHGAGSSRNSEVSISIENALGAFDFLESEDYFDGYGSQVVSRRSSFDQLEAASTLSPESTTKTADSGIESLANRISDDQNLSSSMGSTPEPATSGNEQVDNALLWHLAYCERLLENLGSFGPLKCREIYSLDKLRTQADILEMLLKLAKQGPYISDIHKVLNDLLSGPEAKQFWVKCVEASVLYTSTDRFMAQVERSYGDMIREKYDINATRVFRVMIARILDVASFDPDARPYPTITLYQLSDFFRAEQLDMGDLLQTLAGELWISGRLRSGSTDLVIKTMLTFRSTLPPPDCLRVVGLLLLAENHEVRGAAVSYLQGVALKPSLRDKALVVFLEALEDKNADVRCAACMSLKILKAVECIDQLAYICHTDSSLSVKAKAKETLLSFGEEGRKACEQVQLSSHGFQGVNIRPKNYNVKL